MKQSRGFTLIELMVVVIIVAILAAIAIPSYVDYVRRGKITEAISTLSDMRVKLEQYFQDNRTYAGAGTACGVTPPVTLNTANPAGTVKYFTYTCTAAASTYTITATGGAGTGGDNSMAGFTYKLDQANTKTTFLTTATKWTGDGSSCWVIRQDGAC